MMARNAKIKLYGEEGCHKTNYYKLILDETGLPYLFLDIGSNKAHAEELRRLYENGKLNFPTITIGQKKLRNPPKNELLKWLNKLLPQKLPVYHDKRNQRYTMEINGEIAWVAYELRHGTMYLTYSEVPFNLRGIGIGAVLVKKTFEKLTEEGFQAVAVCSFIRAVASRDEKWKDIIRH